MEQRSNQGWILSQYGRGYPGLLELSRNLYPGHSAGHSLSTAACVFLAHPVLQNCRAGGRARSQFGDSVEKVLARSARSSSSHGKQAGTHWPAADTQHPNTYPFKVAWSLTSNSGNHCLLTGPISLRSLGSRGPTIAGTPILTMVFLVTGNGQTSGSSQGGSSIVACRENREPLPTWMEEKVRLAEPSLLCS